MKQTAVVFCVVYLFSYVGILLRLAFEDLWNLLNPSSVLTDHNSTVLLNTDSGPLYVDFFANTVGSMLMGFLSTCKDSDFFKKYGIVYDGLSSGVMGSFTTFSAWQGSSTYKFFHHNVFNGFLCLFIGFSTSYVSFLAGRYFSVPNQPKTGATTSIPVTIRDTEREEEPSTSHKTDPQSNQHPTDQHYTEMPSTSPGADAAGGAGSVGNGGEHVEVKNKQQEVQVIQLSLIVTGTLASVGLLVGLNFVFVDSIYVLALISGPIGAVIRHFIGLKNKDWPMFPLFTFLANIVGTAVYGIGFVLSEHWSNSSDVVVIVKAVVMTGFAGCLTTVSTFMVQCYSLDTRQAYCYGLLSIFSAQTVLIIIYSIYYYS